MGGSAGKGGKGGGAAPSAPDFQHLAELQAKSSQDAVNQQTVANRANQTNEFGAQSSWHQDPNGQWTQQSSLGGPLGTAAQGLESQAAQNAGHAAMTGDQARDQAITAAYGQASSRLDPQWNQRQQQVESQLSAQGLDPSSEAYQKAMGDFSRDRNDAYTSAQNSAIGQGTAAQQATFMENQAAQMAPYQQLGALSGLSGQAATPMAGQAQAAQILPAAMAKYQADQQSYGQDQQGKNSKLSGVGGLAGGIAGTAFGGPLGGAAGSKIGKLI